MTFAAARSDPATREDLDQLLASRPFRTLADLLPAAMIVLDRDENVLFINQAAEKLVLMPRREVEKRPFEYLLRRTNLGLDEWLSSAVQGRTEGRIQNPAGTGSMLASRRIIPLMNDGGHYTVLTLQNLEAASAKAKGASANRSASATLIFSPELEKQISQAVRASRRGIRVLLLGESGVGKTAVAKQIHSEAIGPHAPFVHVNCGSIPETLFESEMFGYERGAFTGALQSGKRGFIENAAGGTLFLDEVGEIPHASQAKLLKFLEDGSIQPVGSAAQRRVDTTIITATNRNLSEMVSSGSFRRDLFFRLATFPVILPSLRDRPDRHLLLDMFLCRVNATRTPPLRLSAQCREYLLASEFAGNIRELRSIIDYLDVVVDEEAEIEDLRPGLAVSFGTDMRKDLSADVDLSTGTLKDRVHAFEKQVIASTVRACGSKRLASEQLGIDISTLIRKQGRVDEE